jgi:hypothetical protein
VPVLGLGCASLLAERKQPGDPAFEEIATPKHAAVVENACHKAAPRGVSVGVKHHAYIRI